MLTSLSCKPDPLRACAALASFCTRYYWYKDPLCAHTQVALPRFGMAVQAPERAFLTALSVISQLLLMEGCWLHGRTPMSLSQLLLSQLLLSQLLLMEGCWLHGRTPMSLSQDFKWPHKPLCFEYNTQCCLCASLTDWMTNLRAPIITNLRAPMITKLRASMITNLRVHL
jgi:hypothetical protein